MQARRRTVPTSFMLISSSLEAARLKLQIVCFLTLSDEAATVYMQGDKGCG
jgi:hypothetical protein